MPKITSFLYTRYRKLVNYTLSQGVSSAITLIVSFFIKDILMTIIRLMYYRLRYKNAYASAYKILHISTDDIKYAVRPQLSKDYSTYGYHILDGTWDKKKKNEDRRGVIEFSNYIFYQSLQSYLSDDVSWRETPFFKYRLDNPGEYGRYSSEEKIERRMSEIEQLYQRISKEGYKSQREIGRGGDQNQFPIVAEHNEIKVNIGREGRLLFEDGRHRISIAKILQIDEIPVRVLARHKEWQKIREVVSNYSNKNEVKNRFNEDLVEHPDLQDVLPEECD